MTDSLAPTLEQKKSRRGLLALVGAGGAAAVAALLGRSNKAEAHGDVEGFSNTSDPAVHGDNKAGGPGVQGNSSKGWGVWGHGAAAGIHGTTATGNAVQGIAATSGKGVYGSSATGAGVKGFSSGGTGVKGESGGGGVLAVGVHGLADDIGVLGASAAGIGVKGSGTTLGVWGEVADGTGVRGHSNNGTGVKGSGKPGVYGVCDISNGSGVRGDGDAPASIGVSANNIPTRRALRTRGRVEMNSARKVKLSNMSNLVTLPPNVTAGSNAIVLAVVQGAPGNEAFVRRAYRVDSTHIRIVFDKTPANPTAVGYWVIHTG